MQKTSILFFDGALKGNPEAAGAAAIVLDPSGQEELHCKWGLWKTTNNQEEAAALYQGPRSITSSSSKIRQPHGGWRLGNYNQRWFMVSPYTKASLSIDELTELIMRSRTSTTSNSSMFFMIMKPRRLRKGQTMSLAVMKGLLK